MKNIQHLLLEILKISKNIVDNIITSIISIILIVLVYKFIKWIIDWHFKNTYYKNKPLSIQLKHKGNDIEFEILEFDGENYNIVGNVIKFKSNIKITYEIFMHKTEISKYDILRLSMNTLYNKHIIPPKKSIKLSKTTTSNLVRILKNSKII